MGASIIEHAGDFGIQDDSLNEYSIVIVDFEVEFSDIETKQSYDDFVADLKTSPKILTRVILLSRRLLELARKRN